MDIKRHIPNSITSLNLLSGSLSVVFSFAGEPRMAVWCILAAAVFDFLDGLAARLLHTSSPIGKELDSLADAVSFGLAPAVMMFLLLGKAWGNTFPAWGPAVPYSTGWLLALPAFLIAVFSALRLAMFNLDERQTTSFIGLPTPANALFICGLSIASTQPGSIIAGWSSSPWFLLLYTLLCSYLLVSELPMFSLKFKSFGLKDHLKVYVFLGLSFVLLLMMGIARLSPVILLYILLSAISRSKQNRLS